MVANKQPRLKIELLSLKKNYVVAIEIRVIIYQRKHLRSRQPPTPTTLTCQTTDRPSPNATFANVSLVSSECEFSLCYKLWLCLRTQYTVKFSFLSMQFVKFEKNTFVF